jgi:benzoyl-CoA reductase subunit A
MKCYVGIDLGSTTTKAVYMDEDEMILGRGITNSRSNYELACEIASEEAAINSRFQYLENSLRVDLNDSDEVNHLIDWFWCKFKLAQHLEQVKMLEQVCARSMDEWAHEISKATYHSALEVLFERMRDQAEGLFIPGEKAKSDFFRDIASSQYMEHAEFLSKDENISFEKLTSIYDKAILRVEAVNFSSHYKAYLHFASAEIGKLQQFQPFTEIISKTTQKAVDLEFEVLSTIGTGYGRQTLPFSKDQIRSEILCHGLGAHFMFPETSTVLDIGGQDTKAIQVDPAGIVTNFQMNDRCAAGCGRYLGYIADEMNMGVHELGPMAMQAHKTVKINSTCTVFAGAELRERLALGERREDILSGLHRAIILRAMSLLARSGGVSDEFTFTGGVAKNEAAVQALHKLIEENYGKIRINISPDSIYTGAIGAALFAHRGLNVEFDLKRQRGKRK